MAKRLSDSKKSFSAVTVTDYGVLKTNLKKTKEEFQIINDLLISSIESIEDGFDKKDEWLACYSDAIKEWTRRTKEKAVCLRKEAKNLHDSILLAMIDKK